MLQKIGDSLKSSRVLAYVVLLPLVLVFAVWGASGVVNMDFFKGDSGAAKVNGETLPVQQVTNAWREQQAQWQQRFGGEIPEATRKQLQDNLLEGYIRNALISQRTDAAGYRVGAQKLRDYIQNNPAYQIDGKFSPVALKATLAQNGISDAKFESDLRTSLRNSQLEQAIQVSGFLTQAEMERLIKLEDEQREVHVLNLSADKFAAAVVVDDAAIAAAFKRDQAEYMSIESVRLQYAELRLESLAAQVAVADSDLKSLYDKNANRNLDPEKRRARHILIAIAPGKEAEALAKANALVAEAKAGKDFSELARKNSTDSGSAAQGGDLGWAERSAFVGPFSDALFSMQENAISGPVKSQFGYHIIRLDGIQAGHTKSFDEARAELDAQYRRDKAADLFGEKQEQIQARLEQPGADFAVIAKDFRLTLGEVLVFVRGGGGAPLGSDKSLQDVVFGDAVLNQHRTGGPLVLGEDRLVLVKVLGHTPAAAKPLAEVRDQVVAALRKERGTAAARAAADKAVARIKAGDSFDKIAKDLGVTADAARFVGRGDPSLAALVRDAVFAAPRPRSGAPAVVQAVTLEQGGAAVFQIYQTRATVDNSNPELAIKRRNESLARYGVGDAAAYIEELRRKADVTKNPKVFE